MKQAKPKLKSKVDTKRLAIIMEAAQKLEQQPVKRTNKTGKPEIVIFDFKSRKSQG